MWDLPPARHAVFGLSQHARHLQGGTRVALERSSLPSRATMQPSGRDPAPGLGTRVQTPSQTSPSPPEPPHPRVAPYLLTVSFSITPRPAPGVVLLPGALIGTETTVNGHDCGIQNTPPPGGWLFRIPRVDSPGGGLRKRKKSTLHTTFRQSRSDAGSTYITSGEESSSPFA